MGRRVHGRRCNKFELEHTKTTDLRVIFVGVAENSLATNDAADVLWESIDGGLDGFSKGGHSSYCCWVFSQPGKALPEGQVGQTGV